MTLLVFAGRPFASFPAVVKRLNMLRPGRFARDGEGVGFTTYVSDWSKPAHYFKDWLPFNLADESGADTDTAAFGAFTTAPDGTEDTARLLVETTANSQHSFIAGWASGFQWTYGRIRLAGIFKSADRRIVLTITSAPTHANGVGKIGCKAVFDLPNGRVAVDTTTFGNPDVPWTIYPARIANAGNGWWLCYIEALATNNNSAMVPGLFGKVSLDNGVGLAAESSTYAGDGTSGVYGWRSNMLPSRAWNLKTVAFFDDFDDDTMANIDLTNSKVEGFDWYIDNGFPSYEWLRNDIAGVNINLPVTNPATLSVANSVLTCSSHPVPLFMSTFAPTWDGVNLSNGYVGRGFTLPALFESRAKWDITQSNGADAVAFWTASLEWLVGGRYQDPTMPGVEVDFWEALHGDGPEIHIIYYHAGDNFVHSEKSVGLAANVLNVWYATRTYPIGSSVIHEGTAYTALRSTTGDPPDESTSDWGEYVQGQAGAEFPAADFANFHDYATLWLPYDPDTGEPGQIVQFFDGAMCSYPLIYGPELITEHRKHTNVLHDTDHHQFPILLGCGPTMGVSFDWVRVTK